MTLSEVVVLVLMMIGTGIVWAIDASTPNNKLGPKMLTRTSLVGCIASLIICIILIMK